MLPTRRFHAPDALPLCKGSDTIPHYSFTPGVTRYTAQPSVAWPISAITLFDGKESCNPTPAGRDMFYTVRVCVAQGEGPPVYRNFR